jgi:galactokinase
MTAEIEKRFDSLFEEQPLLVVAPGRINIIGEHTDYNEGFVLPAAIDKHIVFAVSINKSGKHKLVSADLNDSMEISADEIAPSKKIWANYLLGVIAQLQKLGLKIGGVNCVFGGDIPLGAGLSSSAALETGFAYALNEVFQLGLTKLEIVKLSQKAEHEYAGVLCGIMDQFASVFGERNSVIRLDCRSLDFQLFPIDLGDHRLVLCDTRVHHSLASSEYNVRRRECEEGVATIREYESGVSSLRDVTFDMLVHHRSQFDPTVYRRCKYVVEENQRLMDACRALSANDIAGLGRLMYETHAGLRDEYNVSCEELDILVDLAKESCVTGARMMGGGFGGCTLNLVEKQLVADFLTKVETGYRARAKKNLKIYDVSIEQGTHQVVS